MMTRDEAFDELAAHDAGGDATLADVIATMPADLAAEVEAVIGAPGTSSRFWASVWLAYRRGVPQVAA